MGALQITELNDVVVRLNDLLLARELLSRRGTAVDDLDLGIKRLRGELAELALGVH